jgi:ornithine decarboxylase
VHASGKLFGDVPSITGKIPMLARGMHTEQPKKQRFLYYINDGVYGSFNCLVFDHAVAQPIPAKRFLASSTDAPVSDAMVENKDHNPSVGTFFGPTCDSMDVVAKEVEIEELSVGDWVAFEHMGAYTSAAASRFNGIELPVREYVDTMPQVPNTAARSHVHPASA